MSYEEKEKMLDLLCEKFVYGLSEEEAKQLEELGYDPSEADSIELTVAALALADIDSEAEMPAGLHSSILSKADQYFDVEADAREVPQRQIVPTNDPRGSWFGWLGWAAAVTACIALAVTLFIDRGPGDLVNVQPPTPTPELRLDPARDRQRMVEAPGQVIMAQWGKGNVVELAGTVSGDVVWSDEEQKGYLRFRGLPKNDAARETYQLWIFDETQDAKTPIDGGTFDVTSDGEVIVPIDARLKAKNPSAFAVTIEKPGGVVVSKREKVAVLAAVKPKEA